MNDLADIGRYGVLSEPATLTIERLLPGPIERVWSYLTDSDLRRKWLASGEMTLAVGAPFELVWRNDELTDPAGTRPDGMSEEHRMTSEITALDPPHRLSFTWDRSGGVTLELTPQGDQVRLTVTHHRLANRAQMLGVSTGWHSHLDLLEARLRGTEPGPFWESFARNRRDYEARIPG